MKYSPTVDVVIPCYNVEHIIKKCVYSIINQKYNNTLNIYLVNDGSADNTPNILNSFSDYQNIYIINHKKNLGLSAARNAGIQAGNGEVVCFLDSDMVVQKNWVESHLYNLLDDKIIGVIGDSTLPDEYTENSLDKYFYDHRRGARQVGDGRRVRFPYFLFNNTSVKRCVFDRVGLFDEKITTYGGEDTDLAIRIWEIFPNSFLFSSQPISQHYHVRDLKNFCKSMYNYGNKNFLYLLKKHPQYKRALGGQYINSIIGYIVFNPLIRIIMKYINKLIDNYWLKRYMVIDSVIRGARKTKI